MLRDEIEDAKALVTTDRVQITIGEIATMYRDNELEILPEFQRLFRWSLDKKSNFIESILIGIPIPPAFAYENEDGTWELIDGLQRISTILEFMGLLRDPDQPGHFLQSSLKGAKYLPSLQDVIWKTSEVDQDENKVLEKSLQLFFRRARIDFQVLKHPSAARTKFDLFQRLNRGGAYANEQEVRSCSMVLANNTFTAAIREFCNRDVFSELFRLSPDQRKRQLDIEYATRLIVHSLVDYENESDVQEFLDKSIVKILLEEDQDQVIRQITWTAEILTEAAGDMALIPPDDAPEAIAKRFSLRALEAIAVGVSRNKGDIERQDNPVGFVRDKITAFWQRPEVNEMSAAGLRGTTRLQRTIPFGQAWFNPNEQF
ncbi:DUF262 domain-containing protein [Thalassospira sp. A40-3]|uniref:DUF262 domain-containing protein n=1 Tax=Thalassospira sp. A40-3 TaxID=2785908 RepID=UPI0018CF8F5A|nr:DUF262 domain-containing protein [Thalassospira sp. A40-3]QPO12789.1 DUF262 domain-containing protein [Thalassospira sp. A40-3]